MFDKLNQIKSANSTGEFYFTDVVAAFRADGRRVGAWVLKDPADAHQVNDRVELASAEALLYARKTAVLMLSGVTIHQPESQMIDYDCHVGRDTEIFPGCEIRSGSSIGEKCLVSKGCVIVNTKVGDGVNIKPYSIFTDSVVDDGGVMGPFCHLRPASRTMKGAHVGNFVELKKTTLGIGSKANHLTYLGDCTIGERANIGAGTITCNYDGFNKMPTEIGDGAFIGSDTQLVAPVKVGANAYVAAGTTVTKDVPDGALAISRVEQKHVEGYAERKRARAKK
jgi:bifunctional UDP-N-acetylglucosamine pyrophosphorylase/glucosamine-1-phosphate N-acetyltransferase